MCNVVALCFGVLMLWCCFSRFFEAGAFFTLPLVSVNPFGVHRHLQGISCVFAQVGDRVKNMYFGVGFIKLVTSGNVFDIEELVVGIVRNDGQGQGHASWLLIYAIGGVLLI